MAKVLVTGGTGFLGAHCVIQLLAAGHEVRATVRDLRREDALRAMLRQGGAGDGANNVALFAADLTADAGWKQAVTDCDYVLHVASPFPGRVPKDENELIRPARGGALRVLRAARDANVRRVVLTSSFAAIGYGKARAGTFTETDWTDPHDPTIQPYQKSKTLAERAAWAFMRDEGGSLELAVIDPTGILGPVLGPDLSTSIHLIKRMLEGSTPGCPDLWFGIVDVRDAADLHVRAMTNPGAAGEIPRDSGPFHERRADGTDLKGPPWPCGPRRIDAPIAQLAVESGRPLRSRSEELVTGAREKKRCDRR